MSRCVGQGVMTCDDGLMSSHDHVSTPFRPRPRAITLKQDNNLTYNLRLSPAIQFLESGD